MEHKILDGKCIGLPVLWHCTGERGRSRFSTRKKGKMDFSTGKNKSDKKLNHPGAHETGKNPIRYDREEKGSFLIEPRDYHVNTAKDT